MLLIIEGGRQNASCIFICISGNEHNQFASRQYHLVPNTTYFKLKLSQYTNTERSLQAPKHMPSFLLSPLRGPRMSSLSRPRPSRERGSPFGLFLLPLTAGLERGILTDI